MKLQINAELTQGDFTFSINTVLTSETTGIFGASGAGKSTLLHLLSGLKRPDRGRIVLDDTVLVDTDENIFTEPEKRGIGVVFQDGRLFPHMTVKKNLLFANKRKGSNKLDFDTIVSTLELSTLLARKPSTLSGGERQRVAIGRALLSSPVMLLLDEPFSAIDTGMRSELLPFISRIRHDFNIPILMISHDLPELLYFTDSLMIIDNGRLLKSGDCHELMFDESCSERLLSSGASSSFYGRVLAKDPHAGTTEISTSETDSADTPELRILAPYHSTINPGDYIRARVAPDDIILSAAPVEYISAQNQFRAVIRRRKRLENKILIEVAVNGICLITAITIKSDNDFLYFPENKVWILFKAHAISFSLCSESDYNNAPKSPISSLPTSSQLTTISSIEHINI